MTNFYNIQTMNLSNPVVMRKVPMTQEGCDVVRTMQTKLEAKYAEEYGTEVKIPLPTVMDLIFTDYAKLIGLFNE